VKSFEFQRIHNAQTRRTAYDAREPKIWWETAIFSTLVIADAAVVADVMRSPNFTLPDIRSLTHELARRHSLPLVRVQETMNILPVLLEGEQHMRIRKMLGQFVADKLLDIEPGLPAMVTALLDAVPSEGETELVTGLLTPLVRAVFSKLVGQQLTDEIMSFTLVSILEGRQNLASLTRLDDMLDRVFHFLAPDSQGADDFICRLCCLVFGVDNVMSTLAENLAAAFQAADGHAPAELPAYPTETMIASICRRPLRPTEIAGHAVLPSTLVRLQFAPLGYSADKGISAAMFGAGRHACIGKQLSLSVWKHLAEQFNARKIRGRITHYQCHTTHTFNFVKTLRIAIEP
jgi:cytochrome P450